MGLWKKIKKGVKKVGKAIKRGAKKLGKAVKKVGDAVEKFVRNLGEYLGSFVAAVGNGLADGLRWIGEKTGLESVFSWLAGLVKGVFSIASAVIKAAAGIIGSIVGGVLRIVAGILRADGSMILGGLGGILSSIVGAVIVVVGRLIAWVQRILTLQGSERRLTQVEISQLQRVFHDSISFYVVRIVEGDAGVFDLNSDPFTLGNTIYTKQRSPPIELLVHEATHVWQYQHLGTRYASDALWAQWTEEDAYDWEQEIASGSSAWADLNREAQAEFLEDVWLDGELRNSAGGLVSAANGSFFDADWDTTFGRFERTSGGVTTDYTAIARDAVETVRELY